LTENIPYEQPRRTAPAPLHGKSTEPGVCSVFVAYATLTRNIQLSKSCHPPALSARAKTLVYPERAYSARFKTLQPSWWR